MKTDEIGFTFRLSTELMAKVRNYAEERDLKISQIARRAIREFMERVERGEEK